MTSPRPDPDAERRRVREWVVANPGKTRAEAAAALGMSGSRIGALLGAEARLSFAESRDHDPEYSDEEVLAGLRQAAAELGEPLSSDRYDAYCQAHGLVSSVRIIQRFRTWNSACAAAGLETRRTRQTYRRRWTENEIAGYVADYLRSPSATGSYAGYEAWAKDVAEAPSGQSVRNAFRGWAHAKSAALRVLSERDAGDPPGGV